jgi:predicted nucleic acid-binding protein
MSERRGLVLDANILLRGVFGKRVRQLLEKYEDKARFYTPDVCFEDARRYIQVISNERGLDVDLGLSVLEQIGSIVEEVDPSLYEEYQSVARDRIGPRDPDDWPVVATALLLALPIWTEDQDFFGSGVGTWTSDRVELYLQEHS